MADTPFPDETPEPLLGLSREAIGYLVVSAGVAAGTA